MLTLFLLIPIVYAFIIKVVLHKTITWKETGIQIAVSLVILTCTWALGMSQMTADTEIWNGKVTGKERVKVSCEHSYDCNCSTDKQGNRHCSTCYNHFYDVDWRVYTTLGTITINRINRQGTDTPPRWVVVNVDDPVSDTRTFTNYVKAVPDSLFQITPTYSEFDNMIPNYPQLYDYYRVDRVLPVGVSIPNRKAWDNELAMRLRTLGPDKKANVVIVMVNTKNQTYADALSYKWLNGKKNDAIVVIGTDGVDIWWVRVVSWSDSQIFKVTLRDELYNSKTLELNKTLDIIEKNVRTSFVRKNMEDFAYLKDDITPSTGLIIIMLILSIGGSIGMGIFFHKNDI